MAAGGTHHMPLAAGWDAAGGQTMSPAALAAPNSLSTFCVKPKSSLSWSLADGPPWDHQGHPLPLGSVNSESHGQEAAPGSHLGRRHRGHSQE